MDADHRSTVGASVRDSMWKPVVVAILASALSACAIPRVIILEDPLSAAEHTTLGITYERQAQRDLAAREYRAALRRDGTFVPALMGLGNVAIAEGHPAEAESYYRQVLAFHREHAGAANNLAMLYLVQGDRLQEAETWATLALEHAGSLRPHILDTIAHIYLKQGRCRDALLALEQAQAAAEPEERTVRNALEASQQQAWRTCPTASS